ncbi:NB-ARC domain-containing protein [Acidicapsa acidisoli]|uniref:NB-ARC domain-containing protein n=1 Tax=Acidicapsa acidisoli TaxID=1615681 RepID=UPI0021E00316|nr:NB-ARC domain-containing protein [Acidicapsa acidisoli]
MAPQLPEPFIQRPVEFNRLKSALLSGDGDAIALTAPLRGAGGFGKTVLASALAHDEEIQDAFPDGILWVTLGQKPNLVQILADLIYKLTLEHVAFSKPNVAANRLKDLLERRHCLLVIDDAWYRGHLRHLLDGAFGTTHLITTRRSDILPSRATRILVDAMTSEEAVQLLGWQIGDVNVAQRNELIRLASEGLGEWPILLGLVNGFLRGRIRLGENLEQAIRTVRLRLDRCGLSAFDRTLETDRTAAIDSTVRASLDLLAAFDESAGFHAQRYHELAIFAEDVNIPIATIARLWRRTANSDAFETDAVLERFYELALLQLRLVNISTMTLIRQFEFKDGYI